LDAKRLFVIAWMYVQILIFTELVVVKREGLSMKAKIAEFNASGIVYYVYKNDGVMFVQRTEIAKRRNDGATQQDRRDENGESAERISYVKGLDHV
jgi:hypothetical protein